MTKFSLSWDILRFLVPLFYGSLPSRARRSVTRTGIVPRRAAKNNIQHGPAKNEALTTTNREKRIANDDCWADNTVVGASGTALRATSNRQLESPRTTPMQPESSPDGSPTAAGSGSAEPSKSTSFAMTKHILIVLARMVAALMIADSLVYSHMKWGQSHLGDGQQAMGFIIVFLFIGIAAAAIYFVIACLFHFFLRKKRLLYTLLADGLLFALFAGTLVLVGITATYN